MRTVTRRAFLASAAFAFGSGRPVGAADYSFVQYHNQTVASPLHRRLVEMWTAIGRETKRTPRAAHSLLRPGQYPATPDHGRYAHV